MKFVKFALRYELRLWTALFRWIFRRPLPVEPGARTFPYAGAATMLFGVFIVLSALEIPILHLMLPWPVARKISLIVGAYGLFWMIGLLATLRVYPHLVGPAGLRIRNGSTLDLPIAWDDIDEIRVRRRSLPPGGQTQYEDGVLSLGVGAQTSIDVRLRGPMTFPVKKTAGAPVTAVRFHTDTPEELIEATRAFRPAEIG